MRILLSTLGTAGDIVSFARLAHLLLARGHSVTVHCPEKFGDWFSKGANIVFAAGDIPEVQQNQIFNRALREAAPINQKFHFARWFYGLGETDDRARAYYDRARQTFASHDLALINTLDHIGQIAAEHINLPWASFMSRPPPDPALADSLNVDIDRALSDLLSRVSDRECSVRTFRAVSPLLNLVSCSPQIISSHPLSTVEITGAWFDSPNSRILSPQIEEFLSQGPALVTTFGTLPDVHGRSEVIIQAAEKSGWRAIVQVLSPASVPTSIPQHVLVTRERIPFDSLFTRVTAVVHHGGAGTIHEVLRAGRPSLAIPHIADQFFWGNVLERNGLGPAPIRHTELDTNTLAEQMAALKQDAYTIRAQELAPAIAAEDGVAVAANLLESALGES